MRETQQNLDRCRLPGAVRAKQAEQLTRAYVQVDPVECRDPPAGDRGSVNLAQTADFDRRSVHWLSVYVGSRSGLRRFCIIAHSPCPTVPYFSTPPPAAGGGSSALARFSGCLRSSRSAFGSSVSSPFLFFPH